MRGQTFVNPRNYSHSASFRSACSQVFHSRPTQTHAFHAKLSPGAGEILVEHLESKSGRAGRENTRQSGSLPMEIADFRACKSACGVRTPLDLTIDKDFNIPNLGPDSKAACLQRRLKPQLRALLALFRAFLGLSKRDGEMGRLKEESRAARTQLSFGNPRKPS